MKKLLLVTALLSLNAAAVNVEVQNNRFTFQSKNKEVSETILKSAVVKTTILGKQITLRDANDDILHKQTFEEEIDGFDFGASITSIAIENVSNPLSLCFKNSHAESVDLKVDTDTDSKNITLKEFKLDQLKSFSYGANSFDPGIFQFALAKGNAALTIQDLKQVILADMQIQAQKAELQNLEQSLPEEKNKVTDCENRLIQKRLEVQALAQENKALLEKQGAADILQYQDKIKNTYFGPLQPQSEDAYVNASKIAAEKIEELKKEEQEIQKRSAEKSKAINGKKDDRFVVKAFACASFAVSMMNFFSASIEMETHGYTLLAGMKIGSYVISALQMMNLFK